MVGNALKFTSKGEIKVEARVGLATRETTQLEFSVADTGVGIKDEDKSKLFQMFGKLKVS